MIRSRNGPKPTPVYYSAWTLTWHVRIRTVVEWRHSWRPVVAGTSDTTPSWRWRASRVRLSTPRARTCRSTWRSPAYEQSPATSSTGHHHRHHHKALSHWKLISKFTLVCSFCKKISSVNCQLLKEVNFEILFCSLEHVLFCDISQKKFRL